MSRSAPPLLLTLLVILAGAASADLLDDLARPQEGRSMRATSTQREADGSYASGNWDNSNVEPGATKVILDADGPGVITHLWFTFLGPERQAWAPEGSANHQEILLRIYYDHSRRPGVEAPLGDFFACGFGRRAEVISVPVVVEDADSYNCFWKMPFRRHCRIELINESDKALGLLYFNVDWIKKDSLPDDTPYFYAQYRQEYPTVGGQDYVVLETEGKGHFVGTVLSVRTRSPSWFGEGDEKIWIDGEAKPSIQGTGTEDYFLSAWGLQTTSTPYFGTPQFDQWGIVGGHTGAYRWHILDPIVFNTGIKVALEHWGWISPDENAKGETHSWNEREDDYSSVAFWYQTGRPTFKARAPHASERVLPNLDLIFPGADAVAPGRHGAGECLVQDNLGFYPQGQLFYRPESTEDAWVEIPVTVERKEPKRLLLSLTHAPDYGIWQASLDGSPVGGPFDLYSESVEPWEEHLLDLWLEPGEHIVRLACVGKNDRSSGHFLGLEAVRLRERRPRVLEWAREPDRDWRTDPVLYR